MNAPRMLPTPSQPALRDAQSADTEAMWMLDQACFTPEFQFSRRALRRFASAPGAIAIVAEAAGRMTGFCIVQIDGPHPQTAYIVTLDVEPASRNQGLARRLMTEVEARSAAAGASAMELHVHAENIPAIRLYQSIGYMETGSSPDFYGRGLHALVYRKDLLSHPVPATRNGPL